MDYLEKNISVFKERVAKFEFPQDINNEEPKYTIEFAKSGDAILKYSNENTSLYMHSKYDPQKEADNFVMQFKNRIKAGNAVVLFGLGMGYTARAFLKILNPGNLLVIYEPSWYVFKTAMENTDLTDILSDSRTAYIMGRNYNYIPSYLNSFIDLYNYENIIYEGTDFYKNVYIEDYKKFSEHLFLSVRKARVLFDTFAGWGREWTEMVIKNIKHILESNPYNDFMNIFPNKPVIVVAAGPSLDKNIELLKQAKGKFPIVCVYTAYGALKLHGIKPDFIVTLDSHQTINENEEELKQTFDIPVVYLPISNNDLLNRCKSGKIYCHTEHDSIIDDIFPKKLSSIATIYVSGSVTLSALHFAYYMGGNPIITIGFDLAYEKYTHASGATWTEKQRSGEIKVVPGDRTVKGIDGKDVKTSEMMEVYLRSTEQLVRTYKEIKFIDATEGGALKEGMEIDTLANVLEKYKDNAIEDIDGKLNSIFEKKDFFTDDDIIAVNENIKENKKLVEELVIYLTEGKELSEKVRDIFTYGKPDKSITDKIVLRYCELDDIINEIMAKLPLFHNAVERVRLVLKSHQPNKEKNSQLYFANHSLILYKELLVLSEKIIGALREVQEYTQEKVDVININNKKSEGNN